MLLNLTKWSVAYGESVVLRDVEIEIGRPRAPVCLMGRNGVGKSTLLKSMMGLLKTKTGQAPVQRRRPHSGDPDQRALAGISYVPQGTRGSSRSSPCSRICTSECSPAASVPARFPDYVFEWFPALGPDA